MIEIKNLTMKYKYGKGVSDLSLTVQDGEVKGLLGQNGSGKTTTMRSFMGFLKFSNGDCLANDINVLSNPVEAKKIIGYLPGDPQLPSNLTSMALFEIGSIMRGHSVNYAIELAEKFELDINVSMKELSKGNKQKVALILAFLNKPKVMILDEATSSLDLDNENKILEEINENKDDKTLIIISHK